MLFVIFHPFQKEKIEKIRRTDKIHRAHASIFELEEVIDLIEVDRSRSITYDSEVMNKEHGEYLKIKG